MSALIINTVTIPDDGQEHRCVCGHPGYRVWGDDACAYQAYGLVVTDDEGRTVSSCHSCDRELVAALHWQQQSNEGENA